MFKGAKSMNLSADKEWIAPTWEQLVCKYSDQVYRLAFRLTGNQHDAEDLTQDAFVRAFKAIHKFQPGTIEGWLHRITTNLFLDAARRKQRIRIDVLSNAPDRVWGEGGDPALIRDGHILDADVADALNALSPEHRVVVVLCDIEGLSYDEIANILGVKAGTVRSRIHRARAILRASLVHRKPSGDRSRYLGVEV